MDGNQTIALGRFAAESDRLTQNADGEAFVARFWAKDPGLWPAGKPEDVVGMLGWVDILPTMEARIGEIEAFVADVKSAGFERVILAGMGGSSLAPYVFANAFPKSEGGLPLDVLDSTHPGTVLQVEKGGDLATTLTTVASKSGSTAEPTAFDAYLFAQTGKPENFVAITDPGSPFQKSAEGRNFRKIFLNFADIGGRFSALSYFGLVPAALLGLDVAKLLARAKAVQEANATTFGPAFQLGSLLGHLALDGVDKLTFLTSEKLATVGLWLEQLVAESTGKQGKGILPIAGEAVGTPEAYGQDRIFVELRFAGESVEGVEALKAAGHPVVTLDLADAYDIAGVMYHFELATATAGSVLDINPFDQPNVQESKDVTKRLLKEVEENGALPAEEALVSEDGITLYGDVNGDNLREALASFLGQAAEGDYIALQAYLHETPALDVALHELQAEIRDAKKLATTLGYGPRFLHSTGQYHKGGPNKGHFIQLTDVPTQDASIPGQTASWATFVEAQARGDREALVAKDRRVISVNLGTDAATGLAIFKQALLAGSN